MKRARSIIAVCATALLALGLCACSNSSKTETVSELDLGGNLGIYTYEGASFIPTDVDEADTAYGATECYFCDGYDEQYGVTVYRFATEGMTLDEIAMEWFVVENGYEDAEHFADAILKIDADDSVLGSEARLISYIWQNDEGATEFCQSEIWQDGDEFAALEWWTACEEIELGDTGYSMWVPKLHEDFDKELVSLGETFCAYDWDEDLSLGGLDVFIVDKTDALDSAEALANADKQLFIDEGYTFASYSGPEAVKTYGQQIDAVLAYGDSPYNSVGESSNAVFISYYIDCGEQLLQISIYESEGFYEHSYPGFIMGLHEN